MVPAATLATTPADAACEGIEAAGGSCDPADSGGIGNLARSIINVLSIIVGAVSVIMIIIGGFRYVISGGDSNATTGAKNTILYALIGLVVVVFAQIIVRFVMSNASQQSGGNGSSGEVQPIDPGP